MVTPRDLCIFECLARYYVLNRVQIQRLCFTDDPEGRVTRRRLLKLAQQNLISKQPLQMHDMDGTTPSSVYYPARRGLEILAEARDDKRFLRVGTQAPQAHHVRHWLAVSETHITLDAAIAMQTEVQKVDWINEWDTVLTEATTPETQYRLYTLLSETPRLVCAPDSSFLLRRGDHSKVYYLEEDMNTSGVERIAASKTKGYAELARIGGHRRHFPEATVATFTVLMVAPEPRRRDHLRRAIHGKPGSELWRFVAATDRTPDKFLYSPILYRCDSDDPVPLVRPEAAIKPLPTPDLQTPRELELA